MARYIDAEKLNFKMVVVPVLDGMFVKTKELGIFVSKEDVDNQQPADVQEVKHGKWKKTNHRDVWGFCFEYECSNCKIGFYASPMYHEFGGHEYCPHCGAKMDGKDEENDRNKH